MLHAQKSEWQDKRHCPLSETEYSLPQELPAKALNREEFLLQGFLQECDSTEVGNRSSMEDSSNGRVRNTGHFAETTGTNFLSLHLIPQAFGKEPSVLGRDVIRKVSFNPVNPLASKFGGASSASLRHEPTVGQVVTRTTVPHHLVGAPADREKDFGQDACQNPPHRYYTGLYIDQSSDGSGTETMATTKPTQGILLSDAVEQVLKYWAETDALTEKSLEKFTSLLYRYANFTRNLGASTLAEQSEAIATQWIQAKGRDRSGNVVTPSTSTMNTRRSALRKFFRDAELLNLSASGLVVRAYVAPRPTGLARPLTDDEARKVWMYAKDAGPNTRRPVMFALLLSGVHSSEVGLIRIKDVDVANQRVWAHGDTTRIKARWVHIPEPYFAAVQERIEFVRGWLPAHYGFDTFQLTQGYYKRPHGYPQNRAAAACKEVFHVVGLSKDASVTPSSVSLYAGMKMLRDGERIETIAKTLGYSSLDSCAKALCFDWETGEIA